MSAEWEEDPNQAAHQTAKQEGAGGAAAPARGEGAFRPGQPGALWSCSQVTGFWQSVRRWVRDHTLAPGWLPPPLRHSGVAYLGAALLQGGAVGVTMLLLQLFPRFLIASLPPVLGLVWTLLIWGTAPTLFGTLLSCLLVDGIILPPHPSLVLAPSDEVSLFFLLLVGCSLSLVGHQTQKAQRKALAAHTASELEHARLHTVLEVLPVGVFIADSGGSVPETNPAARVIWGQAAPDLREVAQYVEYQGWWPNTNQRLTAEEWGLARALLHGEEALNEEVSIATFDGLPKTILNSAVPIRDARTGAIVGAVAAVLDITERKRLEEALRQAEHEAAAHAQQLEAVFETITDGVFIYDREGGLVRVNRAGAALLGLEADPAYRSRSHAERARLLRVRDVEGQALSPEDEPIGRLLRGEVLMSSQAVDVLLQTREGRELVANVSGAPMRDDQGQIVGGVAVLRDVTERRALEQRTHQALCALLAMAEALAQAPGACLAPKLAGTGASSLAAYRLVELVRQVLGCRVVSLATLDVARHTSTPLAVIGFPPESERRWWAGERYSVRWLETQPALIARLQAGETLALDARQPPLQDEPNPHEVESFLAVPMRIGEQLVGLLILDPLSTTYHFRPQEVALAEATGKLGALVIEQERLRREAEEARANELALQEANRQMNTFLGIASHELKTPLTSVILGLQVVQRRVQHLLIQEASGSASLHPGSGSLLEHLRLMQSQAARLERLVNGLLEVSRLQAEKLELRLELTNLVTIVCEVMEQLQQATPERTLTLRLRAGSCVPVLGDIDRIGQVVLNYLTNALKYSAEECPVEVEVEVEDQVARVRVRDGGPGIPPSELERVWERFHRVPGIEVQSGSGVGLGLGLYICRTFIERHGGQVGVESILGEGSTFWFTLPLAAT